MRRSVKVHQTLTATHDTAAAWTGIGSAISCLWNQRIVPASLSSVLSIFMYLGSILALHITTPALFSMETFNATRLDRVGTQGLPAYTWPSDLSPVSNGSSPLDNALYPLVQYAQNSLSFFSPIVESAAEAGLSGGTLYDVLNANTAIGNVTVNATGFNITCGYVNNVTQNFFFDGPPQWGLLEGKEDTSFSLSTTPRGVISNRLAATSYPTQSIVLYSTIPIIDSDNKLGASIELSPPMNSSVAVIQMLRCSQSLVNQKAVVDSQSGHIIMVEPDIHKTVSSWAPYPGPFDGPMDSEGFPLSISSTDGNLFLDAWGLWYTNLPLASTVAGIGAGKAYLIQKLNLFPTDSGPPRANVTLHELENALSDIVASMFWTLSRKPAGAPSSLKISAVDESFVRYPDANKSTPGPFLLDGFVEVTSTFMHGRLDLSIIAVTAGLAASILLWLLSLPHSLFPSGPTGNEDDIQIDGIGLLHTIWLYRNHPKLKTLLEQVEQPTTDNLRSAGEVRTRLVATREKRPLGPEDGLCADSFVQNDGSTDTLLKSAAALPRKFQEAAKRSGLVSFNSLRRSSLLLHSTLVTLHFALVGIWAKGMEHRITFSLDDQALISLVITVISTTFGAIYSALLVYVSQTLSMHRNIKLDQTLTATHDTAAAWTGIGSAISCLWNQRIVPASLGGVLLIFMYLGSILALHITTPALFSVETFNATRLDQVRAQGLPAYTWPSDLSPDLNDSSPLNKTLHQLVDYASGSLVFFPPVVESAVATGLSGGTLYDVLDPNTAIGNVTVNATGFNITCGYVNDVTQTFFGPPIALWEMREDKADTSVSYVISSTPRGVISNRLEGSSDFTQSVFLYSTIRIIDSDNTLGASIELSPPMNSSVAAIQLLRCSQSLVNQKAVVDSQSGDIITLEPDIRKTVSSWAPYPGPFDGPIDSDGFPFSISSTDGNLFLDAWGLWYTRLPMINIDFSHANFDIEGPSFRAGDGYLIQKLNLFPTDSGPPRANVTLHELENALSDIVASMFWTLSRKPAGAPSSVNISKVNESLVRYPDSNQSTPGPFLLDGFAEVTSTFLQGRLDLSIIAVTAGLAASMLLLLLSLPHSLLPGGPTSDDDDIQIHRISLLHAIWLYRNHPELETLLEQVEHPTTDNLRWAGEVRTRLVATRKKSYSVVLSEDPAHAPALRPPVIALPLASTKSSSASPSSTSSAYACPTVRSLPMPFIDA
ncbi:hypothetical protein C8R45DRAFT_1213169 [Mycena sanguinolenta]|nr:hypothetical protein C8R45DRAFT_1213169 [Mycena sanguinolenta]